MSKAASIGLPDLIRGLEIVYLLIWLGLGILAVWLPKNWKLKVGAFALVLIAGSVLPVYLSLQVKQEVASQKPIIEKRNTQLQAAMARFEEKCKTAEEKIYRTIDNVEGILLENVRPKAQSGAQSDPNWPDAGLPKESQGDWYIKSFLFWEHHEDKRNMRGYLDGSPSAIPGFKFVDVKYQDGKFQRLRLENDRSSNLIAEPIKTSPSRYAVAFENFLDPNDRKLWIAGTKVSIIDTQNNELIAEKTWYSIEPGQGSTVGSRSPWFFAKTCPIHIGTSDGQTRFFVDRVLKPKKGE